ncbi:protocatechuate 3,4-dioxygenase subunit alpha [Actinomadura rupiterrae]|uniref:protocatechuate 3,4-dioxygenase subunit alpha n=1 Tax=Actinomadura rupiterrae TaxID=559627 RepID=UPI0020A445D4|nr:protocatechuate 3,4-dioxygenase subunit alpha [Actinomadura rupiterrae]MCP2341650.1 protocatechuate 3,4-dioxygenase alpha subunit [Actinomadura rupiterrae]
MTPTAPDLAPTPSQTVGPFFGHALPYAEGPDLVPGWHPDAITIRGRVLDGAGAPIPDALVEIWQADGAGRIPSGAGGLRRDPDGFSGFGRCGTDAAGEYRFRTLKPGAIRPNASDTDASGTDASGADASGAGASGADVAGAGASGTGTSGAGAPYIAVLVFARGLLKPVRTRLYFPQDAAAHGIDPVLAAVPAERRPTLVAVAESDRTYRFDIHLQGERETVFLGI